MNDLWQRILTALKTSLRPEAFDIWIAPARLGQVEPDRVEVVWPNRYYRDWVDGNHRSAVEAAVRSAAGVDVAVVLGVAGAPAPAPPPEPPMPVPQAAPPEPISDSKTPRPAQRPTQSIPEDKLFHNFVVGACNQFAHAAAGAVADTPGDPQYNPLFIYGGTGLGKTHLLHAIANSIQRQAGGNARILGVTGEQFTNELIEALRFKRMPDFRSRFRDYPEVLLIDDVQFISGKERTQEELFHTFEWLKDRRRQIVFTADVLPRDIRGFVPRLRTRFESGMIADMQPPDIETLVAIIHQKGADKGLEVAPDVAHFIGARVRGSIREIEGVLNRLLALCRLHHQPRPTVAFARQHLGGVLPDAPNAPGMDEIIKTVASFYNIKLSDMLGTRRLKTLVRPRHVAMWLVRHHTEHSFPEMGRAFKRDHATVQHGVRKIESLMARDADLRNTVQAIQRNLGL